jgi:hypothetical protein
MRGVSWSISSAEDGRAEEWWKEEEGEEGKGRKGKERKEEDKPILHLRISTGTNSFIWSL